MESIDLVGKATKHQWPKIPDFLSNDRETANFKDQTQADGLDGYLADFDLVSSRLQQRGTSTSSVLRWVLGRGFNSVAPELNAGE